MENPYQSPEAPIGSDPFQSRRGLMHHVRVVAILMMVQAALELLMALVYVGMAVFMPAIVREMPNQRGVPDERAAAMMPLVFGGLAAVTLLSGVLHLTAGVSNYRFRGRTLGFAALAGGALTLVTCYCLPTAVALGVYGLIVYLNREAAAAFRMGEAGYEPAQIIAAFND